MGHITKTSLLLVAFIYFSAVGSARNKLYLNSNDSICKSMVKTQGYICHDHSVTTRDGYILGIQRIPAGRNGNYKADKPPVLLQHGLMVDAATWLFNSPEESLGFILADKGFDVWLANTRGTISSRSHKSLGPNDPTYWNWSWDELVEYDLSASVQYVNNYTGQKLHYVGHSLGTLIALASFSEDKLVNMIRSAALLSPIAYLSHISSEISKVSADIFLAEALYWLGVSELVPKGEEVAKLVGKLCKQPGIDCSNLMNAFTGPNCCLNASLVTSVFLDHEPQSTATKNMIHMAQMIRKGTIQKYDYGNADDNNKHYGQPTPPIYNMTNISKELPLFLSYGGKDELSDVNDVQILLDNLQEHDKDKLVVQYIEDYAHADFVMAVNANKLVYDPLLAFFNLY